MNQFCKKTRTGLTLIEIMVTIVITSIAVIAAMGFRYYCVMDARRADVKMSASRIASVLIEDWEGMGASATYNAAVSLSSQLSISSGATGFAEPADFTLLGKYKIDFGGAIYYATLSYEAADLVNNVPKKLNVGLVWRLNYQEGTISSTDPSVSLTTYSKH